MIFGGFQKLTLLDYPGKVGCTLFTKGCNFCCPFCHNALLVNQIENTENISSQAVIEYLKKRKGILEGICITGGEPLIHTQIEQFMRQVKDIGYYIKLDTNGSFPDIMIYLINEGLVDYVAMDIKNTFEKYPLTTGQKNINIDNIKKSIDYLMKSNIDYEFRTTVVEQFHTVEDIKNVAKIIKGANKYYLQNFVDSGCIIGDNLSPVSENDLEKMKILAMEFVKTVNIRG